MLNFDKNNYFLDLKIEFKFPLEIIKKFFSLKENANKAKLLDYFNLINFPDNNIYFESLGINKDFAKDTSIQCNIGRLPPHTDIERRVSLLCPISGVADTVFYFSSSEELVKRKLYNENFLIEICREQFKIGNWYLFNNQQIHCVENMLSNERIGLVINLNPFYQSYEEAFIDLDNIVKKLAY
jgi:hypothetical protein